MFLSKDGENLLNEIKPVEDKPLHFTAPKLFYPETYSELVLQPFYKIHEKRYSIYFKKQTPEGLAEVQRKLEEKQKAEAYLREITLDFVAPGEQQPESDHGILSKNSNSGLNQNKHWRDATGWFSYDLRNKEAKAKTLRVTYFGKDSGRKFKIMINGTVIAEPHLKGTRGNDFFEVDYTIPQELAANNEILTVRFEAKEGSTTAGIYGVRLLSVPATQE